MAAAAARGRMPPAGRRWLAYGFGMARRTGPSRRITWLRWCATCWSRNPATIAGSARSPRRARISAAAAARACSEPFAPELCLRRAPFRQLETFAVLRHVRPQFLLQRFEDGHALVELGHDAVDGAVDAIEQFAFCGASPRLPAQASATVLSRRHAGCSRESNMSRSRTATRVYGTSRRSIRCRECGRSAHRPAANRTVSPSARAFPRRFRSSRRPSPSMPSLRAFCAMSRNRRSARDSRPPRPSSSRCPVLPAASARGWRAIVRTDPRHRRRDRARVEQSRFRARAGAIRAGATCARTARHRRAGSRSPRGVPPLQPACVAGRPAAGVAAGCRMRASPRSVRRPARGRRQAGVRPNAGPRCGGGRRVGPSSAAASAHDERRGHRVLRGMQAVAARRARQALAEHFGPRAFGRDAPSATCSRASCVSSASSDNRLRLRSIASMAGAGLLAGNPRNPAISAWRTCSITRPVVELALRRFAQGLLSAGKRLSSSCSRNATIRSPSRESLRMGPGGSGMDMAPGRGWRFRDLTQNRATSH